MAVRSRRRGRLHSLTFQPRTVADKICWPRAQGASLGLFLAGAAIPDLMRSLMRSRSNSARPAMMVRMSLPLAVERSTLRPVWAMTGTRVVSHTQRESTS